MKINEIEYNNTRMFVDTPELLKDFFDNLETECSDAMNAIRTSGRVPYRGYKAKLYAPTDPIFYSKSNENRRPTSTPSDVQQGIDQILYSAGFGAIRHNSIFITSSKPDAENYCHGPKGLYIIIPVNGFEFTWSTEVWDLYATLTDELDDAGITLNYAWKNSDEIQLSELIYKLFKEKYLPTYRTDDFIAALESYNEIMVKGDYYAISNAEYGNKFKSYLFGMDNPS